MLHILVATLMCFAAVTSSESRTNVIFVMFDDLRPLMGAYGHEHMITPNFDRLAAKSVIFDSAHCQVCVCSPSRASLISGLRPDTIKSYTFTTGYAPFASFPEQFMYSGYNVAGFGKLLHSADIPDTLGISHGMRASQWYPYQTAEERLMNSTVNPDHHTPEEGFRDYMFATKAIAGLKTLASKEKFFFLGVGFKLPHIRLHFPHKYLDMYRSVSQMWNNVDGQYLQFPPSAPSPSYRCCAYFHYEFMESEGNKRFTSTFDTPQDISNTFPSKMYHELMWGYAASITFVDKQFGRLLDAIDELGLWDNVTLVLTSDHGMHNGEKGIWEKWTLFEEATNVPLMIYHPSSPFGGKHVTSPVELIDIYPTLMDLNGMPRPDAYKHNCFVPSRPRACVRLDGESLAPSVLGVPAPTGHRFLSTDGNRIITEEVVMGNVTKTFAVSQVTKCAKLEHMIEANSLSVDSRERIKIESSMWHTCSDKIDSDTEEVSLIGYSLRSRKFRYTVYFHFNTTSREPLFLSDSSGTDNVSSTIPWGADIYPSSHDRHVAYEELYSHRSDHKLSLVQHEVVNVASDPRYESKVKEMYIKVIKFIRDTRRPDIAKVRMHMRKKRKING